MTVRITPRGWWPFPNRRAVWKILKYTVLLILAALMSGWFWGLRLGTVGLAVPPDMVEPLPPVLAPSRSFQEIRGVWITTNDMDILRDSSLMQDAVTQIARVNLNTIYPVIWNSGYVMYPSPVAQQAGIQPFVWRGLDGQDMLADLTTASHRRGLLVIPWFEFGFMAPPMSELTMAHPDWLTQRLDGSNTSISGAGEVCWLNPFHPQVQQFITDLVLEAITRYDVDGIQFDDHTSLPVEFGYDPYTIALYQQETQQAPPADPHDPAWIRWRADKLTAFMTRLHEAVKARKPRAIFSVSPNPYDVAYNSSLQDWLSWVRQDLLDELVVQVYRPDLPSFVDQISRSEIQEAQQRIPTGVGVLTGLRNNPVPIRLIQAKVQAARSRGLGIAFFFYESLWDQAPEPPAERQSSFRAMFPSPAARTAIAPPPPSYLMDY